MNKDQILYDKIEGLETQLREIFEIVNSPIEKLNYMQLRVAAYRKINTATELIDRLLEIIETEFITEDEIDAHPSVIFLNKEQEEERNSELREICVGLREIRWTLISHPENYQNVNKGEITETGN